jgi:perosamine synthetase
MKDLTKNPFGKFNGNEQKYIIDALDSFSKDERKGKWVQTFEEKFCDKFKVKHSIACNSATSGLHAALVACGVQPGDEVIVPALGVVMDSFVAINLGAIPVFADIELWSQNINPLEMEKKITNKTKAIIAISLQGLPCNIDLIMAIAKYRKIKVIEDSAQTFLGKYKGKISGTIADISVFSFESKKHLTTGGEGGMIVTNDSILAEKARKFAGIGYKHLTADAGRTSLNISIVQDPNYERFDSLGLNYRMTEISAAIGLAQLERVEKIIKRRQKVANLFKEAVKDCIWMKPQYAIPEKDYTNTYYTFSVIYEHSIPWKEFYNQYKKISGDGFYGACQVIYKEPIFKQEKFIYRATDCPIAELIQPKIMQFKTNYRDLNEAEKKANILSDLIDKIGR